MKESYHICFTSHGEVLFRDEEDHGMFVNLMALRGFSMNVEILADAEMSTHVHLNVFTECPAAFSGQLRSSYSRYFNHRWGRKGRFGEKGTYVMKVRGFHHQMVLENYILRNGLHHGAAATAFGYKFCSSRELFLEDICFSTEKAANYSREEIASFLPRYSEFPDNYVMDSNGVFLRQSFMELRRAETYYGTPRNYLYQMNRLTDDNWIKDQMNDDSTDAPITLAMVEQSDEKSVATMLNNEYGRHFDHSRLQDMDVCRLIDNDFLPALGVKSVYALSPSQKNRIARQLKYDFRLPDAQISRCLVL
ncbi:MAG: hypothetical protein IK045_09360 [Bacteroidales bacterium]|nr:hypothetical protein [Bacteroidales bacterium]